MSSFFHKRYFPAGISCGSIYTIPLTALLRLNRLSQNNRKRVKGRGDAFVEILQRLILISQVWIGILQVVDYIIAHTIFQSRK